MIAPRKDEHEYDVDHRGDLFYIRTNQGGRNFASRRPRRSSIPRRRSWKIARAAPRRRDAPGRACLFANHLVLYERATALPQLRVAQIGVERRRIASRSPSRPTRVLPTRQPGVRHDDAALQLPVVRDAELGVRLRHGHRATRRCSRRPRCSAATTASKYTSERIDATAPDGTKVPISLVYLKTVKRDGAAPLYLGGYGSYGIPSNVGVLVEPLQPARSRRRLRDRAHPRRRRPRQALARSGADAEQEEHVHRLHRGRRAPGRAEVRREGSRW